MNQPLFRFFALALLGLAAHVIDARAAAGFTNNTISGTFRFSNASPVILKRLNAPNRSTDCSFKVVARSRSVSTEQAVIVRVQRADNINGPWTDIPGAANPYCAPSDRARQFYRTRN